MKRNIIIALLLSATGISLTQCRAGIWTTEKNPQPQTVAAIEPEPDGSKYKVYLTHDPKTELKLDSYTGQLWQIDRTAGNQGIVNVINGEDLSLNGSRFEMTPAADDFHFILVDRPYNRTWHVRWSHKASERGIEKIN